MAHRDNGDQGRDQCDNAQDFPPLPDLVIGVESALHIENFLEVRDLVGDRLGHVGLERVQIALVMNHPESSLLQVAVVAPEFDFGDGRTFRQAGIHGAQRLGGNPHIAVAVFVAVGALVVKCVRHTDVGPHVLQDLVGQREDIARDVHRMQLAGITGSRRLTAEVVGAANGRVAAG